MILEIDEARSERSGLSDAQADFMEMVRLSSVNAMGTALAHEINQPLTALLLYLQTMLKLVPLAPDTDQDLMVELVGKSVREAQRAAEIVKRIRQLAEGREPTRRTTAMAGLIEEALEVARAGRQRRPEVRLDLASAGQARVDAVQILQVLVNLIGNAFDAVEDSKGSWIAIATRREERRLDIIVTDAGPGIAPSLMPRLFKPFETGKRNGIGLGLSISQAIAHAHGGDLRVDPGGNGKGASFTLSLPIDLEPAARQPARRNQTSDPGSTANAAERQGRTRP